MAVESRDVLRLQKYAHGWWTDGGDTVPFKQKN